MISVIVPNWNGRHLLKSCLDSLSRQTERHEVVFVDDASTDGSAGYVEREFPAVRVVRLRKNSGFAAATNAGIRVADGEYIAFLNNDAEADPHWLAELQQALMRDATLGFVGGKILYKEHSNVIAAAGGRFGRNGSATDFGRGEPDAPIYNVPRPVLWVTGAACMFRRKVFETVGLLDESFGSMWEDVDICLRAQLAGFRGLYVPTAVVYHAVSATWEKDRRRRLYLCSRNECRVLVKNLPRRVLLKCLPHIIAHQLWNGFIAVLCRDNWSYLRGKVDFFLDLRSVCEARQRIQASRTVSDEYILSLLE